MTKILVSDGLSEAGLKLLREAAEVVSNPKITPEELVAALPEFDALVVRSRTKVKANVIAAGTKLKVIGRAGVGVDNIDVAAAVAKNITVVNSPLAASAAVAELAIGLMFALARNIAAADASLKQNKWEKSAFMGTELQGKTLGLLGVGRIGAETAKRAAALGMTVMGYDPNLQAAQIQERGVKPATFDEVLAQSDYVSMHMPLTATSKNIIGVEALAKMKKTARLVCAARGGTVDEDALRAALDAGALAGAALDVFAAEPPAPNSIATHPKVVATPHIGAQSAEAQTRAGLDIAEEVLNALQGKPLRWKVLAND